MVTKEIERRIVEVLRALPVSDSISLKQLRAEIGCGTRDLSKTLSRMRLQGKIAFDVIALSPSMREPRKAPPTLAEQVEAEADQAGRRRADARSTGTVSHALSVDRSLIEAIQTELADSPHDLLQMVTRRHADAWQRVVGLSRLLGERPAQTLYRVLEAGLDVIEADVLEDREVAA